MGDIKFGTDGWRGRIGDDYTFANLRRATQGYANYLAANILEEERAVRSARPVTT